MMSKNYKSRLTVALLVAGGMIAIMDAAKVAAQAAGQQTQTARAPKPVWVATNAN
jgi:hypothetical protein